MVGSVYVGISKHVVVKKTYSYTHTFIFRYILDCVSKNEKLNYRPAYLLPAGKSSLLMEDIEQGQVRRS